MPPTCCREAAPGPGEPGEHVRELGELDLQFPLLGPGAAGEDVEDEPGAVDDLGAEGGLQVLLLGRGELRVEYDGARTLLAHRGGDFEDLPLPDEGGGLEPVQPLGERPGHGPARRLGQALKLEEAGLRDERVLGLEGGAHEHRALEYPGLKHGLLT